MKHVHKLAWIGLFVNIIICFVARNLLLDEGQLNFHSRADGVWSWLVLALFIAVVVQAISIMLSGRYPYLAIVLAFVGGIVMVPASVIFWWVVCSACKRGLTPDLRPGDQPRQWARLITSSY